MSRTLSASTTTEVAKSVTIPRYLVQIDFATPVRWSSRETLSWNSLSWTGVGVSVEELRNASDGTITGRLRVANHDNSLSSLILGESAAGQRCQIWILYGASPFAVADAEQLFDGIIDGAGIGLFVSINLLSSGVRTLRSPRVRLGPPDLNHIPPPGETISWGPQEKSVKSQGAESRNWAAAPPSQQQIKPVSTARPGASIPQPIQQPSRTQRF